jgi:hypothetical protein
MESGIARKCIQELGISCEVEEDRWRHAARVWHRLRAASNASRHAAETALLIAAVLCYFGCVEYFFIGHGCVVQKDPGMRTLAARGAMAF